MMVKAGGALQRLAQELEQQARFAEYISAQLWAHLDSWENEGGYCGVSD